MHLCHACTEHPCLLTFHEYYYWAYYNAFGVYIFGTENNCKIKAPMRSVKTTHSISIMSCAWAICLLQSRMSLFASWHGMPCTACTCRRLKLKTIHGYSLTGLRGLLENTHKICRLKSAFLLAIIALSRCGTLSLQLLFSCELGILFVFGFRRLCRVGNFFRICRLKHDLLMDVWSNRTRPWFDKHDHEALLGILSVLFCITEWIENSSNRYWWINIQNNFLPIGLIFPRTSSFDTCRFHRRSK